MKRTLRDLSAAELLRRRALVRVDYNVPLQDGRVTDLARVEASVPTLEHLLRAEARPVLLSHLGRPKGSSDPRLSLAPVAPLLSELLGVPVAFGGPADAADAVEASRALTSGEVLLLENTRFLPGETSDDDDLARRLATLGDLFVNDAFGSLHRAHASIVGLARHLRPAVAGLLVEAELEALDSLRETPARPFVVALGGAKVSDKVALLKRFAETADRLLVGGAMANTFLRARGLGTGRSLVEENALEAAREVMETAGDRLRLPTDLVVAPASSEDGSGREGAAGAEGDPGRGARTVPPDGIPAAAAALDVGPETREAWAAELEGAATFFWNGPMGRFEREPFDEGTVALARAAAEATRRGAFTVIGGGDSAAAIRKAGVAHQVSHVSTGGGAALEYLATGTLPGLEALDDA